MHTTRPRLSSTHLLIPSLVLALLLPVPVVAQTPATTPPADTSPPADVSPPADTSPPADVSPPADAAPPSSSPAPPAADAALPPTVSDPDLYGKSLEVAAKAVELFGRTERHEDEERVAEIGYRVAQAANFQAFPFTFHVVEMPAPNAFALPGGHVFVTRGMLELDLDDDMLAGLLGHEIAHVVKAHGTRMQRRATLMQALSQVLMVGVMVAAGNQNRRDKDGLAAPYDPRKGGDQYTASMVQGTAAASLIVSELLLRGYSRDFEREADDEGQRFAAGAGFAPGGLRELMALMEVRLPQSKDYGYWQTHPFFEERVRGSQVRTEILTPGRPKSADAFRRGTQEALVAYKKDGKVPKEATEVLEQEILLAWPRGPHAEEIRLGRAHRERDEVLSKSSLERDYGVLIGTYEEEIAEVDRLDPESALLPTLRDELGTLRDEVRELYPKAQEILAGDVYQTPFLELFLSNYPQAPEVPRVALALGDAYSRLGNQADGVTQYLKAWEAGPESPQGQRALVGLKNLTPLLESLAALEQLARQDRDPELAAAARERLGEVAGSYKDLVNGAEYLRRYPNGEQVEAVTARLNALADQLYTEVILYQGVGDMVKALDRINAILTHAPASPAAAQIRNQAVVEG